MIWYAASSPPDGFLECNGQSTVAYPSLAAIVGATVPDLRGNFIRGWAHDRTSIPDAGRLFGSFQTDEIKSHHHALLQSTIGGNLDVAAAGPGYANKYDPSGSVSLSESTVASGGTETRPPNVSLLPCIKY